MVVGEVVDVKVPSWRVDLSNTVTCGSMPCS